MHIYVCDSSYSKVNTKHLAMPVSHSEKPRMISYDIKQTATGTLHFSLSLVFLLVLCLSIHKNIQTYVCVCVCASVCVCVCVCVCWGAYALSLSLTPPYACIHWHKNAWSVRRSSLIRVRTSLDPLVFCQND